MHRISIASTNTCKMLAQDLDFYIQAPTQPASGRVAQATDGLTRRRSEKLELLQGYFSTENQRWLLSVDPDSLVTANVCDIFIRDTRASRRGSGCNRGWACHHYLVSRIDEEQLMARRWRRRSDALRMRTFHVWGIFYRFLIRFGFLLQLHLPCSLRR